MSTKITYLEGRSCVQAADAFIRFVSDAELSGEGELVQPQIDAEIRQLYTKGLFKTESYSIEVIPALGLHTSAYVIFAAFSPQDGIDGLRKSAAAAAKALKKLKSAEAVLAFPSEGISVAAVNVNMARTAQAITEGLLLSLHERERQLREPSQRYALEHAYLYVVGSELGNAEQWAHGINRGRLYAQGTALARDLTNMPGNDLTPERLAFYAEELAQELELDIEVIDEWTAAEQGMGGLLGVGQGSVNPPRMIVIHYTGAPDSDERWGLVGKGITFDTGGISLKRAPGMEEMISDMAGAAAVLGAMRIIGECKPPVNIVAVIPTAENMPSDRAFKPGDVITMMSGHTVEIVNTDAEGRLVLADGLTTAIRRGATKLVDVATLTGAVITALGTETTGAVTNNDALMKSVLEASELTGERVWQLPAYPEYKKLLKSNAADLKNSGIRQAGTIVGGLFIGHFAEDLPWVHLDIAGTSWLEANRGWDTKGATGVMVRTLAELIMHNSSAD